jgi:serine protease Do
MNENNNPFTNNDENNVNKPLDPSIQSAHLNTEEPAPIRETLEEQPTNVEQSRPIPSSSVTPQRPNKTKGNKAGYFLSALAGVIVGALLIWLMMPALANHFPNSSSSNHVGTTSTPTISQNATAVTTDVTGAVEKVSEAVVGITNIQETSGMGWFSQQSQEQAVGSGSGVIYKVENGKAYIVTNHHVVEGATQLEVTLADGSKVAADLVGSDVWTDLAVIVMDAENVNTVATFGDSDVLKVGEAVIAIGNPLGLDFYGSVTQGIVSGKDRSVPVDLDNDGTSDWTTEVLQTDAAINSGNSGGALVNLAGELVGINSMKIASSEVEGLGFSIPINTAIPVIEQLEKDGQVKRPTMGISLMDVTEVPAYYQQSTLKLPNEVTNGVVVTNVASGSAAEKAGLKVYDVIVEMDGEKIEDAIALRKHLYNEKQLGDELNVKVYREGKIQEVTLTLVENTDL